MDEREYLLSRIDEWVGEGLISPEQGEILKGRESELEMVSAPERRVQLGEIFVYMGSLVIFLAMAFLVWGNWDLFGSAIRILSVLVPTVLLLGVGWWLRRSEDARLKRGAQALWLAGCLLSGFAFGVLFYELDLITTMDVLVLVGCVLATVLAGAAFALIPSIPQSITFHLCGSAAFFALLIWLEENFPPLNPWRNLAVGMAVGGSWLALSEWLETREIKGPATVARVFGSLTVLGSPFILAMEPYTVTWYKTVMEALAFLTSVAFIAASVKRQSQIYLYSGAAFLLFWIIYVNFEHFAEKIGMPIALLIIGVLLIGLGLGTGRLSRRIRGTPPSG